jgi:hypothetical protein
VPQRFTKGNTYLGWSRILKLFLEREKKEEVKRRIRQQRMQRIMQIIMVPKLEVCSKKDQYFGTYHIASVTPGLNNKPGCTHMYAIIYT